MPATPAPLFRPGSVDHRTWLLACAARLDGEGATALAKEARAEAEALLTAITPVAGLVELPCEDCGRPVSTRRMPQDWPFDWWSHKHAGRACRAARR